MPGIEILHMGRLTLLARRFLKTGQKADLPEQALIKRLTFHVRSKKFGLLPYGRKLAGLDQWLGYLSAKGVVSTYLLLPDEIDPQIDLSIYANFMNLSASWVMGANTERDFSTWRRKWKIGPKGVKEVDYFEKSFPGLDPLKVDSGYAADELPAVLRDLAVFSRELGLPQWAERFHEAGLLRGASESLSPWDDSLPGLETLLPRDRLGLLRALARAWVFEEGWTDIPRTLAIDQGRGPEYRQLSWALYRALMRGLMHCFNE